MASFQDVVALIITMNLPILSCQIVSCHEDFDTGSTTVVEPHSDSLYLVILPNPNTKIKPLLYSPKGFN